MYDIFTQCYKEYDDIFLGDRKKFSPIVLDKNKGIQPSIQILKYVFEKYLEWSPSQACANLTPQIVKEYKLNPIVKRLMSEDSSVDGLKSVVWKVYPETKKMDDVDLVRLTYRKLIDGEIKKFPKDYFDTVYGFDKARICFRYMLNNFLSCEFKNLEEAYAFFGSSRGYLKLKEYCLLTPLGQLYPSPLEYFVDSLDAEDQDEIYYHKYGGKYCFTNDKDMILDFATKYETENSNKKHDWKKYSQIKKNDDINSICSIYRKLIDGEIKEFPKNYFNATHGYNRARICFKYMLDNFLSNEFYSLKEAYAFFGSSNGYLKLKEYCLLTPLVQLYPSVLDYFVDSLYEEDQDEIYYHKYGGKYSFTDDKNAVLDFVKKYEHTSENKKLIHTMYQKIINKEIKEFPKDYFNTINGLNRARVCFNYMLDNYLSNEFKNLEEIYSFFGSSSGYLKLKEYYLLAPLEYLYPSAIDYLVDSLDETDQDEIYYHKYGGKYCFTDNKNLVLDFTTKYEMED